MSCLELVLCAALFLFHLSLTLTLSLTLRLLFTLLFFTGGLSENGFFLNLEVFFVVVVVQK